MIIIFDFKKYQNCLIAVSVIISSFILIIVLPLILPQEIIDTKIMDKIIPILTLIMGSGISIAWNERVLIHNEDKEIKKDLEKEKKEKSKALKLEKNEKEKILASIDNSLFYNQATLTMNTKKLQKDEKEHLSLFTEGFWETLNTNIPYEDLNKDRVLHIMAIAMNTHNTNRIIKSREDYIFSKNVDGGSIISDMDPAQLRIIKKYNKELLEQFKGLDITLKEYTKVYPPYYSEGT